MYTETWTVINVIEIDKILQEQNKIMNKLNELMKLCKNNNCIQSKTIDMMFTKLQSTEQMLELLNIYNLYKRGLINKIGEIQKLLWDNLAESDLENINNAIDEQIYKLNNTIRIVKNST